MPGEPSYVHSLAVKRRFARQWIGRAVLDWAAGIARNRSKRRVRLDCMYESPRRWPYYSAAGFRFLGRHPQYAWHALFETVIEPDPSR